jgi:EAL domain-containing protein (putative c-di-GMP-specific phosphodiesterase class I)
MPPDDFIPLAEENGAIAAIGRFVLEQACRVLARWQSHPQTRHRQMNVNVSTKQIRDPGFVGTVQGIIREASIEACGLTLEITETAMIENPDHTFTTLSELKRLGVSLALDDFGTGYSSLSFLKRFPIDVLKIDKSFIRDLYLSERETLLTGATIAFGKQLDLKVFAEGIETEEQLDHLQELGCEYGQGYLFSLPLREAELDAALASYAGGPEAFAA